MPAFHHSAARLLGVFYISFHIPSVGGRHIDQFHFLTPISRCVDYFNSSLPNQDLTVEAIRTYYPQPDFDPEEYVLKGQAFGNTGGGCMVGTAAFHLPSLDKTVWVNCSCEGVHCGIGRLDTCL